MKKKVNLENVCHWQSHRRHIRIWNELFTRSVYWHHILGLLLSFYEYRWPNDIPVHTGLGIVFYCTSESIVPEDFHSD